MDEAFELKVRTILSGFRDWANGREFTSCRLVQYCGVDLVGAINVSLDEVAIQIDGLTREAFSVDWAEHQGALFLRVWEFDGPEPEWPKVFAEEPLANIEEILRDEAAHIRSNP